MDTGAALGAASVAALGLSPFWPVLGLAALCVALGIAAWATFCAVRGLI